jgi:hypothetical protein
MVRRLRFRGPGCYLGLDSFRLRISDLHPAAQPRDFLPSSTNLVKKSRFPAAVHIPAARNLEQRPVVLAAKVRRGASAQARAGNNSVTQDPSRTGSGPDRD